ncbi:DNA sulfur modification protein DndD [Rhizobium sp. AU243]|uniref:DNA sulfur modification protein DndD n=1 Tax=Rhizobium sp. AU243 TaxID=2303425 RepID=UPI0010CCA104|nr:DNA sulfur modification protein DndD [Rhizobium sp. AU243]TKV70609.1 DNA sulfur modification protein DndD [Rhizobium sp. AU243]
MILREVKLCDFGLYAGMNEIDLVPRQRHGKIRPIILIGGKNGSGKTTLLEAVRLALYGKRALGTRVAQVEYEDYLKSRISKKSHSSSAGVSVTFDYAEGGSVHQYEVRREWTARGKGVVETLLLQKDGVLITSVPRDEWQSFLQELIPPGVSQLFFFDGERISEIADAEHDADQLPDAMRGLLGIELVGRLRIDLGLYLARHQDATSSDVGSRLETVTMDIQAGERRADALAEQVAELRSQRESQARQAERIRRQFVSEGGDVALQRTKLEAERDEVRRAIGRADHELRDLANRLLPFAMAPKLIAKFRGALSASTAGPQIDIADEVRQSVRAWRSAAEATRTASWSCEHWTDLETFIAGFLQAGQKPANSGVLRDVGDGSIALKRLGDVEVVVRPRALALLGEMEGLQKRLRELDTALARADSADSSILLDELRLADRDFGATEVKLNALEEEHKLARGQLTTLLRERQNLLSAQAQAAKQSERANLAAKAAEALADYEGQLLAHKLGQLRAEFLACLDLLMRKEQLIADLRIDPASFVVTLFDANGGVLDKQSLSAGEKQIYAVAMLWALARTSGRPLPMIIDTPLGRLDSEHRARLIERYFGEASHQVILLSTDTEVNGELKDELASEISHTYLLDFNAGAGVTRISRGYFDDNGMADANALQQA